MKSAKDEKGVAHFGLLLIVVLALVVGVGLYVHNNQKSKSPTGTTASTTKKLTHPNVVKSEVFATSLDTSGAPISPTDKFTPTTPKIYVALGLSNAKATQRVEYTRYRDGKFVDNRSAALKDGAKYAYFVFDLKTGKKHPKGTYTVKTYTNGVFERSAIYTVQ